MQCPLCQQDTQSQLKGADRRQYFACSTCLLIFADPSHHLSASEEKLRYLTHENNIENAGYVSFLNRAIEPALRLINQDMQGLDYGCGPEPVLCQLLARQSIHCSPFDPIFYPQKPQGPFDFIFATECLEHFFNPLRDITTLFGLLKPRGIVIIMTELWTNQEHFANWYYTRDPTHVCFYHRETFEWLAKNYGANIISTDSHRVFILEKS